MAHTARLDRATAATLVAALLMPAAVALIFFYVPSDVDQGYSQRIFYFHVPIALTTYTLFAWGAVNAARYLWTGREELDLQSYVPMHLGVIFGSLTLITGSISVEPGERRARYSAVYALLGVGLIPLSVLAVRIAQDALHPIVFRSNGVNMDGSMFLTFLVALAAMLSLAVSMYLVEMRGKRVDERMAQLRRLARGAA